MRQILAETGYLISKEVKLELRMKYALNSIILFTGSTVFICYLAFLNAIDKLTWNALFWIIILFSAVNSIAKTFIQEGEERNLYYYFTARPQSIIISKIIYNSGLLLFIGVIGFVFYSVVMGNPIINTNLFLITLLLGILGLASPLTMISAIAAKASNNPVLVAILSFPIVIPVLILCIKLTKYAIDGLSISSGYDQIITLIAINVIVYALSFILYPYLWKS